LSLLYGVVNNLRRRSTYTSSVINTVDTWVRLEPGLNLLEALQSDVTHSGEDVGESGAVGILPQDHCGSNFDFNSSIYFSSSQVKVEFY
jgi:hypothetical protein